MKCKERTSDVSGKQHTHKNSKAKQSNIHTHLYEAIVSIDIDAMTSRREVRSCNT